jgi:two-component system, sensor histidine kinase LadS
LRIALACLLAAGTGVAMAAPSPTHFLREQCRIASSEGLNFKTALARLDRCTTPAAPRTVGEIWISYADVPMRAEVNHPWRLELDNHRGRSVDVWLIGPSGQTKHLAYDATASDREWATANYYSLLVYADFPVQRLVLRLNDAENMTFIRAPRLTSARAFATNDRNHAALYGLALGALAVTILFHLSLFFAIRRRFQLIYCLHVGLMLLYAIGYSGIVRLAAPELTATGVSRLVNFAMIAGTGTGVAFVLEFLGRAGVPRILRLWGAAAGASSIGAGALLAIMPPALSAPVYLVSNLICTHTILFAALMLSWLGLQGNRTAALLGLGWALPMAVALLYPARNLGLIGADRIPDGLMLMAVTIECLILSVPVAGRIRKLRIEHERAQERHDVLERQAQTDALTGLANRRGFGEALTRAAAAQAEPTPLALLVIDIDHFKRVNDRYGHATGDAILQHVAGLVAKVAGPGAIVSRFGGEEFVVALRGYDLARAGTIAERIRISVGAVLDADAALPPVTVSIGIAAGESHDLKTVLADADCALYRAKHEGRNRVIVADGPLMYAAAA